MIRVRIPHIVAPINSIVFQAVAHSRRFEWRIGTRERRLVLDLLEVAAQHAERGLHFECYLTDDNSEVYRLASEFAPTLILSASSIFLSRSLFPHVGELGAQLRVVARTPAAPPPPLPHHRHFVHNTYIEQNIMLRTRVLCVSALIIHETNLTICMY